MPDQITPGLRFGPLGPAKPARRALGETRNSTCGSMTSGTAVGISELTTPQLKSATKVGSERPRTISRRITPKDKVSTIEMANASRTPCKKGKRRMSRVQCLAPSRRYLLIHSRLSPTMLALQIDALHKWTA